MTRTTHTLSIEEHRVMRGWSRAELAAKAGVSYLSILRWERGEAAPQAAKVRALAAAFGVTPDRIAVPDRPRRAAA